MKSRKIKMKMCSRGVSFSALIILTLISRPLFGQDQALESVPTEEVKSLRDPFNPMVEQVTMPIYDFGQNARADSLYSDLIKVKVLALGESANSEKSAFLRLPEGEVIIVKEGEWFTIQSSDLKITPITIVEISSAKLVVLVDQRSKFILR
jgi:hypothetical protein